MPRWAVSTFDFLDAGLPEFDSALHLLAAMANHVLDVPRSFFTADVAHGRGLATKEAQDTMRQVAEPCYSSQGKRSRGSGGSAPNLAAKAPGENTLPSWPTEALGFAPGWTGLLARISQCAPTARITSGGRYHPDSSRFDLVAGKRPVRAIGGRSLPTKAAEGG